MSGCVHIYCGDGKGKTTAAIGLAIRAAGTGKKVLITRFLKTDHSGEVPILTQIPQITVTPCEKSFGFFFQMTDHQKKEAQTYYTTMLKDTLKKSQSAQIDLLILDEIMAVCNYALVDQTLLLHFLKTRPSNLEVVLTGRAPSPELQSEADYITEMKKIKHPYDQGLNARPGIEY